MSILGKIMNAIFGTGTAAASGAPTAGSGPAAPGSAASGSASSSTAAAPSGASAAAAGAVDVAAILDKAVAEKKEKLEWRTSIVDLMKALNLDSSLSARKELAKDLHYDGDTNDSAKMNIWLHKQLMKKLADNGGKVPADLRA